MGTVSRGFKGRRRPSAELPPGQYLVEDFPVLSAGPTPSIDLADWELVITSETDTQRRWDWDGFRALPTEHFVIYFHQGEAGAGVQPLQQGVQRHPLPGGAELGPVGDAVEVDGDRLTGQGPEAFPVPALLVAGFVGDGELPVLQVDARGRSS